MDGRFLASSEFNRRDHVWRIAPGSSDGGFRLEEAACFNDGIQARRLRFSPDGTAILSASSGTLMTREWRAERSHTWEGGPRPLRLWSAQWTQDGAAVAVAAEHGSVYFFDPAMTGGFRAHELGANSIWQMAFSPDGGELATSIGSSVRTHDLVSGELRHTLDGGPDESDLTALAYSSDGSMIAAGGSEGEIRVWRRALRHPR